ncbi:hypothetical protein [Cupriavidus sp. UGS-1]|uniref:hypothetical protein n=2 Tax=Burkholderiaceae TaxID=119060 RepID=UPI001E61FEA0|nr:hypothetical protein [Cupriavidus sp. UGS-1]MCD9123335.1 hypothetical protein [Cupriavidus sp. UGS-1]
MGHVTAAPHRSTSCKAAHRKPSISVPVSKIPIINCFFVPVRLGTMTAPQPLKGGSMDESHSQELVKHVREIVERLDDLSFYAASSTSQRLHLAAMAMQGLVTSMSGELEVEATAKRAVQYADALIAVLEDE